MLAAAGATVEYTGLPHPPVPSEAVGGTLDASGSGGYRLLGRLPPSVRRQSPRRRNPVRMRRP